MNTQRVLKILNTLDAIELLATGLEQRHLDSANGNPLDPFFQHRANRQFARITALPELTSEASSEWRQIEPLHPEVVKPVAIDLLAWYQPYSDYGPQAWGIYFDEKKMNQYAMSIYAAVKSVRSEVAPRTVQGMVWDEVFRHEREHCVQELTASALSALYSPIAKSNLELYYTDIDAFEALATHFQHTDTHYRSSRGVPGELNFAKAVSAIVSKPKGYDQWNRIDVPRTDSALYERNIFPDVHKIANQFRRNLKKPIDNPYLDIPVFVG